MKLPKPILFLIALLAIAALAGIIARLQEPLQAGAIFGYFAFIPLALIFFLVGSISLILRWRTERELKPYYVTFLVTGLAVAILFWEAIMMWELFKSEVFMLFLFWSGILTLFFVISRFDFVWGNKWAYLAIVIAFGLSVGLLPPFRPAYPIFSLILIPSVLLPPYLVLKHYQNLLWKPAVREKGISKTVTAVMVALVAVAGLGFYFLLRAPAEEEKWIKEGVLISGGYCDAEVVRLDNGTYRMYYGTAPFLHEGKIEISSATSTDGLTWENESGIRLSGGAMPSVVRLDNGGWRMYYSDNGILSAISEDGLEFTGEGVRLPPYNDVKPRSPTVVRLDNGSWRMYYCDNHSYVRSSISGDGLSWTPESGIRVDGTKTPLGGMVDGPDIIKLPSGVFRLYFWSFSVPAGGGIYQADSEDGLIFSTPSPALVYHEPWEFGEGGVSSPSDPSVIQMPDGSWRMYYGICGQIHSARTSSP